MKYRVVWREFHIEFIKIVALFLITAALALTLDLGWNNYGGTPQFYLNVDDVNHYEEKQGSISVAGINPFRDVGVLVRVRGNSTVWAPKRSYSIRFINESSLLGMGKSTRWALLALAYDKALIRTSLGFDYAKAIGMNGIGDHTFCELYFNGEYKGMYLLVQPVTFSGLMLQDGRDFVLERNMDREEKNTYFITTDGGMRFQIDTGSRSDEEYRNECLGRLNLAEAAIESGIEEVYAEWIDVDSFVNAYIAQEVVKNVDFARTSDRYYMKDGKLFAGPLWDLDLSMGNASCETKMYYNIEEDEEELHDSAEMLWAQKDWYEWLCQDPAFMRRVCARWREVYPITENLVYDNELGKNRIDVLVEQYEQEIKDNYDPQRGWSIVEKYSPGETDEMFYSYEDAVEHLRDWLIYRIEWLDEEFAWIEEGL